MNWFNFLLSLAIGYAIYYVLNILYDLYLSSPKPTSQSDSHEIIIPRPAAPVKVSLASSEIKVSSMIPIEQYPADQSSTVLKSAQLESTGGVSINELFSLMQSQVIEYTKAIPY